MQPDITSMLGEQPTEEKKPLEKIKDAATGLGEKTPEENSSIDLDDETLAQLLMSGENKDGMFAPEEKEDKDDPKHAEVDEDAKVKKTKIGKPQGKYANKFKEDITKNPQNYKIVTPKGEMTIQEAMKKGYNPITKKFEINKSSEEIKRKHMEGLNDADKAKLEELTNPAAARVAPKDAQAMGLPSDSPMIAGQPAPGQQPVPGQQSVAMPLSQLGQQGGAPVAPQGGAPTDITSMLGGGM